ncbi:hypothetical protein B0T24DRAFT_162836 [Lasiosphaeria ovina]|uniref:Uncharacterized protein n=1 Tax=Lasiosphaeria ovina TaxID=92902 RepID=A0AAE0TSK1_9PEZI|nr:hypothetical protein B0T24DRAFT_162836 [Lasiosphaeria ovina]
MRFYTDCCARFFDYAAGGVFASQKQSTYSSLSPPSLLVLSLPVRGGGGSGVCFLPSQPLRGTHLFCDPLHWLSQSVLDRFLIREPKSVSLAPGGFSQATKVSLTSTNPASSNVTPNYALHIPHPSSTSRNGICSTFPFEANVTWLISIWVWLCIDVLTKGYVWFVCSVVVYVRR